MCNWRNTDYREGAHSVVAVRLGRGKGDNPLPLFAFIGGISPILFYLTMIGIGGIH